MQHGQGRSSRGLCNEKATLLTVELFLHRVGPECIHRSCIRRGKMIDRGTLLRQKRDRSTYYFIRLRLCAFVFSE